MFLNDAKAFLKRFAGANALEIIDMVFAKNDLHMTSNVSLSELIPMAF